jgi:hypothetical protein
MPSPDAVRREREVVEQVADAIRSASGIEVFVDGWPDEDRASDRYPPALTVEALLRLRTDVVEVTWAVDVMGVTWNPRLRPARDGVEAKLTERLTDVALEHGRGITVMWKPPIGHPDKGAAYVDDVVERARQLIVEPDSDGLVLWQHEPDTQVTISDSAFAAGEDPVVLMYGLTDTASMLDQVRGTLVAPLEKKLNNQLRRAHDLGYPTILALDRLGGDPTVGGDWLSSAAVISQVLGQTIASHGHRTGLHTIDLVVLVDRDTCRPIYGYWPATPEA